jgi:hypothetical protein
VNPILAAPLAVAGPGLRAVIVRYAVPAGEPPRQHCPACAQLPSARTLALVLIYPAGMGMGDVKAAASIGTLLAWLSWRFLITGGFAGFLLAGIYGIALLISGRATRKHQIPFGPFMIAGAFLVILADA